jgi:RHS repeat-associated protein
MLAGTAVKREASDPSYGIYAYTAREWDPEVNLYYYRARYYDPKIGRFISEDPIGDLGGNKWYTYADANPLKYFDPTGLFPYWGNWCGPDWTGGRKEQYDPAHASLYKPPIDHNDAACMRHDWCYYMCRKGFPCDAGNRRMCMMRCDRVLASDTGPGTSEDGWMKAAGMWLYMRVNRHPPTGPDACECPREAPPPPNPYQVCSGGICFDDFSRGL